MQFALWAFEQADLIRKGKFNLLNIENLIEEIECMGRSEHRELSHRLAILIGHLLKPERQSSSWQRTIAEQRRQVHKVLKDSPSLKAKFNDEYLQDVWQSGVALAVQKTNLDI